MSPTPVCGSMLSPKNIQKVRQWRLKAKEQDLYKLSEKQEYNSDTNRKTDTIEAQDEKLFMKLYPKIVEKVITHSDHEDMEQINSWLAKVMKFNVPNGKRVRGLATVSAYRKLMQAQEQSINEDRLEQACILGWCVEILHAAQKMNTNIIGDVKQCRGSESWHLRDNLGPVAFNDAVLLIGAMFYILKEYFEDEDFYTDLLNIFHEAQLFRAYGQGLERQTNVEAEINYLNLSRHEAIVKYQVSYFSYYFPMAIAMSLAGIDDQEALQDVKNICIKLGYLCQVVQDQKYYEADIRNGTPSWFLFEAVRKASRKQKSLIKECYGPNKGDSAVEKLVGLYQEMNLEALHSSFVAEHWYEVNHEINELVASQSDIPVTLFKELQDNISKYYFH